MSPPITRHFVTVGNRRVHYRRAGEGPPIVLLHASPVSSEVYELQIGLYAKHFTAIALDTPGYGLSDPLDHPKPEIEDFADAVAETLDALGIQHCATYGRHTGGSIAVEFAHRHPDRCALALTDGYPVFSEKVRDEYLEKYLAPITPEWDGTHLLWLWFRYREQHVFWPWYKHFGANRADQDVPDNNFLHRGVKEMLMAGNGYKVAYSAAFRHKALDLIPNLKVPVCFAARPGDSVFKSLALLPKGVWAPEIPREKTEATLAELEIFKKHPARAPAPPPPAVKPLPGRLTTDYIPFGDTQLFVRHSDDLKGAKTPVLFIPPLPGSGKLLEPLMQELAAKGWPVIAIDPPGHGDSGNARAGEHTMPGYARAIAVAADTLGLKRAHVYGRNVGALVAIALAGLRPDLVASVALDGPLCFTDSERARLGPRWAPPADPVWDGHHATLIWHITRDQQLFFPWFEKTLAASRFVEPQVDAEALHVQVVEMLKHPESFAPAWNAAFAWPQRKALADLKAPAALFAAKSDPFAPCLDAAAKLLPGVTPVVLPEPPGTAAAALDAFLNAQP